MGNRVNPLFIQKKDLNSDRLQLSFTIHRFSKAVLQWRRGPSLLQTYLQWRRGTWGQAKRPRKVPPSSSGYPAREC